MQKAICQDCSWDHYNKPGHCTINYLLRKADNHERTNPGHQVFVYKEGS